MKTTVKVTYPIYFTLTAEQEEEFSFLDEESKKSYLLDIADHFLMTSSVEADLEYESVVG